MANSDGWNKSEHSLWQRVRSYIPGQGKTLCPDSITLAAYLDSKLTKRQKQSIEDHLTGCFECVCAVSQLRILLQDVSCPVPYEAVERAKSLVNGPVNQESILAMKFLDLLNSLFSVRGVLGYAMSAAIFVFVSFAAIRCGYNLLMNDRAILAGSFSETTFGLSKYFDVGRFYEGEGLW